MGKTTLLNSIKINFILKKVLYLNCDIEEDKKTINTTSLIELNKLNKSIDLLMIDEAQRLENPGLTLKIIYDNFQTKIIATGSSSFELKISFLILWQVGTWILSFIHLASKRCSQKYQILKKRLFLVYIPKFS